MRIKQSICYPIFQSEKLDLESLFAAAAEMGYAAIELWQRGDDLEELVALARKHKLVVASMSGHYSLEDGLNKRSNHDRIEQELRASIDLAAGLGIPGLICFSGNRQPHMGETEAIDAVADGLKRVAEHAEKKEINLNVELLNSKVNHPGYQCDHTAWGVAVCEKVGSPRAKLLYDIYHMQIMEGDVIRTIRDNIQWIGHSTRPATRGGTTLTIRRSSTTSASARQSPKPDTSFTSATSSCPKATPSRPSGRHSRCATRSNRGAGAISPPAWLSVPPSGH